MKKNTRKLLLGIALGVFLTFCLFIFGLGYFIYSLLPSFDNLQIQNQVRLQSSQFLTPECQERFLALAEQASIWDIFQLQKWTESLPSECFQDMAPEALPAPSEPEGLPHDSEVI